VLLPHRKQLIEAYLKDKPHAAKPPKDPVGGLWTH